MMKLNKKNVAILSSIAAIGGGTEALHPGAIEEGAKAAAGAAQTVAHEAARDPRFEIDNSPQTANRLERTIKPKMENLGKLTIRLAKKTEGDDPSGDFKSYDAKTNTVTLRASNEHGPVYGSSNVELEFAAKPGTHNPNPDKVLSVRVGHVDDDQDIPTSSQIDLAAAGQENLGKGLDGPSKSAVYSANEVGSIEYKDNSSLGGPHLFNTRDNEHFVDGSWGNYTHDPVPTAKKIVNDGGQAANIIREAYEQPVK